MLCLPRLPTHWAGCWGPPPTCCGRGCVGVGAQHCPLGLYALWGLRAAGVVGGRPRGGWPSAVVRGVWCQALSLPRPPVVWSGQPGFRDPCVPGAVGAGVGTQHRPHSVRPCGPALLAVGVAEGRLRGDAFHHCEGRLVSGAVPLPAARPLERAARVPRLVCPWCGRCGCGDPAPAPQCAPLRAGVARCGGCGRASPGGGGAFHHCEGRLLSGAVPPRPSVLWSGQPGFRDPCVPGAAGAGVGTQHRPHSVRPCGPALLAVGVAEGRPRGGCLPPLCEGRLGSGVVPPPTARPLGGLWGSATHVLWARVCGCGSPTLSDWPACSVGLRAAGVVGGRPRGGWPATVVRGVWCQALSLPRPPVLWSGQPGFRDPLVPGAVGAGVGTQHGPTACALVGRRCSLWGWRKRVPWGGCLPPL